MREILFRGQDVATGNWIKGYFVRLFDDKGNKTNRIYSGYAETDCEDYYPDFWEVDPETVGQFTGLSDKNGKMIFEGDILVIRNCREHPVLVKFLESSWQCVVPNQNAYIHYRHRLENNDTKYEVIGNICDNPELLKEGDS